MLHGKYDPENLFARMIRGGIPCIKIFENSDVLAIMDVFPQSRGHVLVIPKGAEARTLLDFPSGQLAGVMAVLHRIAQAMDRALQPDGIILSQFSGEAAGQTIFHLHFHLIPRYEGQDLAGHGHGIRADSGELQILADAIAARL